MDNFVPTGTLETISIHPAVRACRLYCCSTVNDQYTAVVTGTHESERFVKQKQTLSAFTCGLTELDLQDNTDIVSALLEFLGFWASAEMRSVELS